MECVGVVSAPYQAIRDAISPLREELAEVRLKSRLLRSARKFCVHVSSCTLPEA